MGHGPSSNRDVPLEPLYYDTSTIPKSAFHTADALLSSTKETVPDEDIQKILKVFPRSVTVQESDMYLDDFTGKKLYRIKRGIEIFQIISHDPNCVLWANTTLPIPLGVGKFSLLRFISWATDYSVEHSAELRDADTSSSLPLEIKYFAIEDDLRTCFPDALNLYIHGKLYGMASGAIGIPDKPLCHYVSASYNVKTKKSNYVTVDVMSIDIEKLVADPRLKEIARNPHVDLIYQTSPSYIKASILDSDQHKFVDLLDEILGDEIPKGENVQRPGYQITWPKTYDVDEDEQTSEEKEKQFQANMEIALARDKANFQKLVDAGILSYDAPR